MWPLPVSSKNLAIAVFVLSVFAAGWLSNGWRLNAQLATSRTIEQTLRTAIEKARADGEVAVREAKQTAERKAKESLHERDREIARLAAAAAARRPGVIRVCPPARRVPAPDGGAADPAGGGGQAGGVVPERDGLDPGAVLAARLRGLAVEADTVSANLRAVVEACSP